MKLTLNNITSGFASATATNTNNDLVEAAIENTLSRDGTSPNQMLSNLDMNGYAILNQRATSGNENFIWLGTWVTGATYAVNNLVYAPEGTNEGATLICVTAHTAGATLNGDAAKWAVFAQRGASGAGAGDVVGPASATADSLVRFNGTTGKLLKNGAVIGTDIQAYNTNLASIAGLTLAAGDILYATAPATVVKLAKGTAGQILTMNTGATAPEWTTQPSSALAAWPVGSIYISISSTNPGTIFTGSTWVIYGSGRTLVGFDSTQTEFDTVEETGGAKTHTLSTAELPAHTHSLTTLVDGVGTWPGFVYNSAATAAAQSTQNSNSTGSGGAHNNLQPYIVVYFWKRTA